MKKQAHHEQVNILQIIRRKVVISTALLLTLSFSLLLFPLASWGLYNNTMNSTSHTDYVMKMDSSVRMTNCDQHHNSVSQENNKKICCDNVESNQSCNDCSNSCVFPVFFTLISESFNKFITGLSFVQSLQSTISSRKTSPPIRPPIALLS